MLRKPLERCHVSPLLTATCHLLLLTATCHLLLLPRVTSSSQGVLNVEMPRVQKLRAAERGAGGGAGSSKCTAEERERAEECESVREEMRALLEWADALGREGKLTGEEVRKALRGIWEFAYVDGGGDACAACPW